MGSTFGRVTGVLYWVCPTCGVIHRSPLSAITEHVVCGSCEHRWIVGTTLWRKPRGPRVIPRDTLLIGEGFANHRLANRCYCETCGKALWEKTLRDKNPAE